MSSAGFVLSLSLGFILIGVAALIGTPFIYSVFDILDYSMLSDANRERSMALNEDILGFYAAFPFIVGIALIVRSLILASRTGQLN